MRLTVSNPRDLFRLNVGFIIHENVGYTRDFPFEVPAVYLPPDLKLKNLFGSVRVSRATQGLLVQVRLTADVLAECVRCLIEIYQPLEINFTELYAFNRDSVTESGLLAPENGKIDLEPFVREEMLLAIPISPLCKPSCMGLCPTCGANLNETICDHQNEDVDPRLSILKTLLEKDQD
jgi:uncharacterized protein